MFIVWGKRLYGRVEALPGVFYLATLFTHYFYFPVIPHDTYLLPHGGEKDDEFAGTAIKFSMRSIFVSYLRAVLIVIAVVTSIKSCAIALEHGQATPRTPLSFADILWFLILIGSVLWIYVVRHLFVTATPDRLLEIAKQAGIDIATASEWIARKPDAERPPGAPSNFA